MLALLILGTTQAHANQIDRNGVVRDDDGSMIYMQQYDAMSACPKHTHLPTAHELAKQAGALGAQGILKNANGSEVTVQQVNSNQAVVPNGYYEVKAINSDNSRDDFYFNDQGYKNPEDHLGNHLGDAFWSSSLFYTPKDDTFSSDKLHAFVLIGDIGHISSGRRDEIHSVRCIRGRGKRVDPSLEVIETNIVGGR